MGRGSLLALQSTYLLHLWDFDEWLQTNGESLALLDASAEAEERRESLAREVIVLATDGLRGFDEEMADSAEIPIGRTKVRVLSLERIIARKKAANREKDRLILPVLQAAAAVLRDTNRRRPR